MSIYYDLYQNPPKGDGEEDERLHARVLPKGTIPAEKFREIVHNATGFSEAILDGTLQAVIDELQRWLADGWIVEMGDLGYFSLSLECDRLVKQKSEIRSPSIHLGNVNLRVSSKFRKRFVTMELERKASPYVSNSSLTEERRRELLLQHINEKGCMTRADYSALTACSKWQAVEDLNRYIDEGILRRYGSGRTVVYLKP